jgi:D-alanyl-lipoteichoic acid acyltransferase DltB (MBOAT superfamily)
MRLFALLIGLLLCCQTAQAQVRNYDAMIAAGELKVAVYKDFAPYSFQDPASHGVSMSSWPRRWPRHWGCA